MADFHDLLLSKLSSSEVLSKRKSSNGNGAADAFGSPPNFSVPPFVALMDDYSEMFGNFHALKTSASVPVLDFQILNCDDVSVDILSSNFNYSEVFGGFDSADFAVYYEDMLPENPSENLQTPEMQYQQQAPPVLPGVPAEELNGDHVACSERSSISLNVTTHGIYDIAKEIDAPLNKENIKLKQHSVYGITQRAQCLEVSGYDFVVDACSPSKIHKCEKPKPQVTDDLSFDVDSSGRIARGMSSAEIFWNDLKAGHEQLDHKCSALEHALASEHRYLTNPDNHLSGGYLSCSNKVFLTISDVNLQTQPSQVPPPSRLPPKLFIKQEDSKRVITANRNACSGDVPLCRPPETDGTCNTGVASETYALDEAADSSSPPFYDVEIDASSASVVSLAAMRETMEKAQASLKSAKESMEKKRENVESNMKLGLDGQKKGKERGDGATAQENHESKEEVGKEKCGMCRTKDSVGDGRLTAMRPARVVPDLEEKQGFMEFSKVSIMKIQGKEYGPFLRCYKQEDRVGEWKAEKQLAMLVNNEKLIESQEAPAWEQNQTWEVTEKVRVQELHEKKVDTEAVELEKNKRSWMIQEACRLEENAVELKEAHEQEGNVNKIKAAPLVHDREENEMKLKVASTHGEMKLKAAKEMHECEENEEKLKEDKDAQEKQEKGKKLKAAQMVHWGEQYEKNLKASFEHGKEAFKMKAAEEPCQFELNRKELKASNDSCKQDENETRPATGQTDHEDEGNDLKSAKDANDWEVHEKNVKATEDDSECEENEKETKTAKMAYEHGKMKKKLKEAKVTHKQYRIEETSKMARDFCWWEEKDKKLKAAQDAIADKKNEEKMEVSEEVLLQDGYYEKLGVAQEAHRWADNEMAQKSPRVSIEQLKIEEKLKTTKGVDESVGNKKNDWQDPVTVDWLSNKEKFKAVQEVFRWLESGKKSQAPQQANWLEERGDILRTASEVMLNPDTGRKEENGCGVHEIVEQEKGEIMRKERKLEKEWVRKIEEEQEREREREKDMISVGRAEHESGVMEFAEAQEKLETVLMERATVEAPQRSALGAEQSGDSAEAPEKSLVQKVNIGATVLEEHATAERETADTWECAARSTLAEKATSEASEQAGRSTAEKFASRETSKLEGFIKLSNEADFGLSRRSCSSDVPHGPEIQSATSSCSSFKQHSNSATNGASYSDGKFLGADGESAKRSKARLERHQRMLERMAKALAEKNLRDILAQRELAERNRLADALDAEVRRWSNGKEGNLRALLSTLQYILGPESGWKPIPLTEVITIAGAKKAYKKAALYVHPDKVQQRRASIQQKYICEKVFDLLKEAWNTFNSEER